MRIDVYSDNICPWCFIGKHNLDAALGRLGMDRVDVRWHAYQLYPQLPRAGVPRKEFMRARFGGSAGSGLDRITAAGQGSGISFNFDGLEVMPNTFDSHRLVAFAGEQNRQHALVEALMSAGFEQGRNIGDQTVLLEIAGEVGLDRNDVAASLAGDGFVQEVNDSLQWCLNAGITGVPYFRLEDGEVIHGAQPVPVFEMLLAQVG